MAAKKPEAVVLQLTVIVVQSKVSAEQQVQPGARTLFDASFRVPDHFPNSVNFAVGHVELRGVLIGVESPANPRTKLDTFDQEYELHKHALTLCGALSQHRIQQSVMRHQNKAGCASKVA